MAVQGLEKLEPLRFPVRESELGVYEKSTGKKLADSHDFKGILRTDTMEMIAPVSKRYALFPNGNLFDIVTGAIEEVGIDAKVTKVGWNGRMSRFKATLEFPELSYTPADGKPIIFSSMLTNAYDGAYKAGFTGGGLRLVCSNGMVIGVAFTNFHFRHVGAVEAMYESVVNHFTRTLPNSSDALQEEVDRFERPLLKKHTAEKFMPVVGEKAKLPMKYVEGAVAKALDGRKPQTYWNLYNPFTNVLTHGPKAFLNSEALLTKMRSAFLQEMPTR